MVRGSDIEADESATGAGSAASQFEGVAGGVLEHLARAGPFRGEETAEHVERMSRTCALIARELGWDQPDCERLRAAAALHDVGKVDIPDAVLRKPGQLDATERKLMERHPEIGHEILSGSQDETLQLAATIALSHHERVDGRGYPRGLAGDEIPLAGRIAAVADVFDALTHERIYRAAFAPADALAEIRAGRGTQFDEQVLDAFERVLPQVEEIRLRYPDAESGSDEPPRAEPANGRGGPRLTPREREIVDLLAGGLTGEEISTRLFISPETVRTHIRNAMNRLGARTRAHLVTLAATKDSTTRGDT